MSEKKTILSSIQEFLKKPVKASIILISFFVLVGLIGKKYEQKEIKDIKVRILDGEDNFFLNESDIIALMTMDGSELLIGFNYEDLELKKLEKRLIRNPYINNAEIYADLKGNLHVKTWLKKPLARMVPGLGTHTYLCRGKSYMPMSSKYTSRVMLIRGKGLNHLVHEDSLNTDFGNKFYEFMEYVEKDPFLSAQISEIEVLGNKELILYPQVTKQYIEFGNLDNYQSKIEKLNLFYSKILQYKGWNTYERVCLKYKNQIVCE